MAGDASNGEQYATTDGEFCYHRYGDAICYKQRWVGGTWRSCIHGAKMLQLASVFAGTREGTASVGAELHPWCQKATIGVADEGQPRKASAGAWR